MLGHAGSDADHIAGSGRGLDDVALLIELFEHLTDDLADGLEGFDVVLGLVVRLFEVFEAETQLFEVLGELVVLLERLLYALRALSLAGSDESTGSEGGCVDVDGVGSAMLCRSAVE